MSKPTQFTVYFNASEIVTNAGVVEKGGVGIVESDLGIIKDGTLVLSSDSKVLWVGPSTDLPSKFKSGGKKVSARGAVLAPGLVDCHTHLVFAGIRDDELAMRLEGKTYQEIAAAGGGIVKSVAATRAATEDELFRLAIDRVETSYRLGVRAIEIKSGYGLDWPTERKVLRVISKLKQKFKNYLTIQSTFLGAHAFPPDTNTDAEREAYVSSVINEMIPAVAREKLADCCDVFFDEGYFTEDQSRRILTAAKAAGMKIKLHADELADTGGAKLAAELGVMSADHLLRANDLGLRAMAEAGVVAVLLPTTAFYLGLPYASVKKMRDAGVCMALASDFNPGSSPTLHLPFVMSLACLQGGMTMPEAFAAATYGAARALQLDGEFGSIRIGAYASVVAFNVPTYRSLIGQFAHPGLATDLRSDRRRQ